jgi:hypothetical protein
VFQLGIDGTVIAVNAAFLDSRSSGKSLLNEGGSGAMSFGIGWGPSAYTLLTEFIYSVQEARRRLLVTSSPARRRFYRDERTDVGFAFGMTVLEEAPFLLMKIFG